MVLLGWSTLSREVKLKDILRMNKLERIVMEYFVKNISVGEIIALIELREEVKKRVQKGEKDLVLEPDDVIIEREISKVISKLISEGYLEYKAGVYNLSKKLIEELKKKYGRLDPGVPKNIASLAEEGE
ncbi:PolB1-binding protein PBP2 family protein [Thermogladius sp. 4427co]|uniref:PolB1-binding protein PBP2 family protein n=1 Tax=Thermogladius sp. 4427co TaxID=3450718 RepID=UPI003F7A2EF3